VVQPDGARRLLGDFEEASWSPRGLYVAAVSGRTLSALEPDGTPHWSISATAPISDPRWSPSGFQIAYRSGGELRATDADGGGDRLIDPAVAPVAAAWSPLGLSQLAYVGADGKLRIADSESGEPLGAAPALPGIEALDWAPGGVLLEVGPHSLRVRAPGVDKLGRSLTLSPARALPLPGEAEVRDAEVSPNGREVAALLRLSGPSGPRSLVALLSAAGGGQRRLLSVPGELSEVAFSPDGDRLLISWPEADQWLFLPTGHGEPRALGEVGGAFAPGRAAAAFPRVEGWCCSP
jgi:Tol biopolymer transport system component